MPHYQKYKLRRINLFVATFTLKETHWNAKLCHWLSGKFLYETVKNDSNSWKQASKNSVKTCKNYKNPIKTLPNSCTWNLSNTNFWPKAKIQSCSYRKLFETSPQLSLFIFQIKSWQGLWNYLNWEDIEVWKRLGWVLSKDLVLLIIGDKIFDQE